METHVLSTLSEVNALGHDHWVNCTAVFLLDRPIPAIHLMTACEVNLQKSAVR